MNRKDDHNSDMNKRGRKTGRRILTGVLALAMVLTQQSEFAGILSVRAEQKEETCKITGFVPLSANVLEQRVSVGTKIGDLSLPDTLEAYVLVEDAENECVWGVESPKDPEDGDDSEEKEPGDGDDSGEQNPGDGDDSGEQNPGGGDDSGEQNPGDGGDSGEQNPGDGDDSGEQTPGDGGDSGEQNPGGGDDNGEQAPGDGDDSGEQNPGGGDDSGEQEPGGDESAGGNGEENASGDGGEKNADDNSGATEKRIKGSGDQGADAPDEARAARITQETVGLRVETGSFVMPVYGSEYMQDDLTAGKLTADGQEADTSADTDIIDGAEHKEASPVEGKDASEEARTESETKTEEVIIEDIVWEASPAYDGDREGVYVFTPVLPEGYELAEDVSLPEIRVSVGCVHGIVAAGEVCPVCGLQEEIDALPDAEEVEEALQGMFTGTSRMSEEEIEALYEWLLALSDTYEGFLKEWQEMVDAEKLVALLALFSGEDRLMTTAGGKDVLIFSTELNPIFYDTELQPCVESVAQVFSDAGYGVRLKADDTVRHLSEDDMDGIGLMILFLPGRPLIDGDISLMRDFLASGGRIVMIGENSAVFYQEDRILSEAAEKLGADFRIEDKFIGTRTSIAKGSADMPATALTQDVKESLTCYYLAPITYTGSAESVLLLNGQPWMVDQAAGRGRITAIGDCNCFDSLNGSHGWKGTEQEKKDTKAWILRWLLDARENQRTVLEGKDPNLGFAGSLIFSIDAKEHVAELGDYTFTVTYTGSDRSPNGVINEATVGTDDVTVKDSAGASLLISKAEIVSGQGTKKLVVRYTVEAQQSNSFTPGDYTIDINNAAVADKTGKQVGGSPKAAAFHVITSPLQITGPDNLVIPQGGTGALSVSVSSADGKSYTYQYQWYQKRNGVYEAVTGATRAAYTLPAAQTAVPGEYTYRCEVWAVGHPEYRIPSEDALVTVEKGIAIDTPTATEIAGKDCDYTLSATLLEAGSERIVETGFVWGIMGSPTLSLSGGSAKTASPVTAANQKISVIATGLTKTVTYYGRAYVKTAGGNVVYSNAVSFGKTGNLGQFSVKNNGNNTFTVTLTGGVGEQMVFYRTVNGSAVGGTHFTHKAGMLTFNGSGSQTVTVTESAVTSTFGGKKATAYSNADRTYSLEIYRPMGGATISAGTAARTMTKNSSYTINRNVYTFQTDSKGYSGKVTDSGYDSNPRYTFYMPTLNNYLKETAEDKQALYLLMDIWEIDDGYQLMRFEASDGSVSEWQFEIKPDGKAGNKRSDSHIPCSGATGSAGDVTNFVNKVITGNMSFVAGEDYLLVPVAATQMTLRFDASGSLDDDWYYENTRVCTKFLDSREPQLVGVAPMAQTAYAVGDNITIALVFDEIVDVKNSTLGSVKIKTNVTNDLSYSGGGDTNVLYFTGKVTTEFKGGDIQLKGITNASYIKDMCDTSGTANTNTSGSTPITTTGTSAPKITLTNNGVTDGMAKAQISAQNADLLQYCFTQDAGMPAAGWMKAGSLNYTATNPALTAGTYYLHAMAINKATGEAAYERTSFTVTTQQQQEQKLTLTADTDNSRWARSRTILLEKKGSGTLTLRVKKPDGTTQSVTGNSYTATANGAYTFTLSNGTKTVTQKVTVSKIDRTNPKVTVSAIPTPWQASPPTVTINGTDVGGSGIASLQYKWVTTKGAYPTGGLTSLGKTGTSVNGTVSGSSLTDGVNYLYYKAVDSVGNTVQGYSSALRLDRITPTITLGAAQADGPNAIFSVQVTFGPSAGRTVCQKQGDSYAMTVRGNTFGVNEAGQYTFTATSGVGKQATKAAPGICSVTLNAGEGIFESDMQAEDEEPSHTDTRLVVSGGKIVEPLYGAPVREHYTIKGWYTNSACTTPYNFNTAVTANRTLYAGWTPDSYSVTYEKNGGTITDETGYQEYTYGKGLTLPTAAQIERTGYTFGGWYTDEDFAQDTKVTELTATDADDKTFYAKWTANEYTVTYDYQGATGAADQETKTVTYDDPYGSLPEPEKTGYSFKGWYTQADGQGDSVQETTKMTVAQDHELYAYWVDDLKPDAPVLQDGTTLPKDWTHDQKTIPLTLHDGVGVTELWVSVDGGAYMKVSGFTGQPGNDSYDYVYEGLQEGDHTYRFRAKDEAGNQSEPGGPFTVKLDTTEAALTVTGPAAGAEKKTGLVLNAKSGSFGPGGGALSVKKDGLLATETTIMSSVADGVLSADYTVKEKGSYHFYSRTNANKADDAAAKETRYVHQVTFDSDGGSAVEPQLVWTSREDENDGGDMGGGADGTAECKVKKPADPTRTGYHFGGWYTDEACQNAFDFDTQLYEDTTLYAGWTQDSVPEITAQLSAEGADSGWHTEKPQIDLTYADTKGVTQILVSVDGGDYELLQAFAGNSTAQLPTSGTDTYTDLQEGDHTYTFKAVNTTGLTAETEPIRVKLDTVKPMLGDVSYNEGYVNLWNWIIRKDSLLVNIPVTEENSGLAKVTYTLTPGSMQSAGAVTKEAKIEKKETDSGTVYTAVIAIDPDYKGVISDIQAVDIAGNVSEPKTSYANGIGVIVESEKPVIAVKADRLPTDTQAGNKPEGEELSTAYYETAPKLLVTVRDGSMGESGIKEIKWQIGSGSGNTVAEDFATAMKTECTFMIDGLIGFSGTVQVKITAVDNAGNSESQSVTVKIKGKEQAPDASPDYLTEKLTGLLPEAEYLIKLPDGTEVSRKADAEGNIRIDDGWFGGTISIIKKGDGVNTEDSDPQSLALAARPGAPSLGKSDETIKGKKDGQITGLTAAMEYSTDGGRTWTAAAENLTDVSAGKYLVRLSATQTAPHGKTAEAVVGEGRTLTVTFDSQGGSSVSPVAGLSWRVTVAKPADPKKTDMVFVGWFKEASCANRWLFAAEEAADRVEEDMTLYAKWIMRAEIPAAVIAYPTETLTGLTPGAVYLIGGEEVTASGDGSVPIDESWFGETIAIIKRGNGTDTGDSNPQLLPVPKRPAGPEQVKPKEESKKNGNNGKLAKTDTTMQYRKAGSAEWISITGEEVTGLEPGDYELRYVATDTAFVSEIVVKTVKKYSRPKDDGDKKDEDDGGTGDVGGNPGGDNTGGVVPGGTNPGGDKKPADTKPGSGTDSVDDRKPGDGTDTDGGRKPGDGGKPGGGIEPGDRTKPAGGETNPAGGKKPADGTNPGDRTIPKHTVEDGRIVPIPGNGTGNDGAGTVGNGNGTGNDGAGTAGNGNGTGNDGAGTAGNGSGTGNDANGTAGSGTGNDGTGAGGTAGNEDGVGDGADGRESWAEAHPYAVGKVRETLTIPVDEGAVIVTVNNVDEALCTAQAADAVAVANAVLTEEEIGRVAQGETIEIRIDVERIDDKVSEQEKSVIEQGIGDAQKEVPGLTVGMYVDISMFLRQGKGEWNAVHRIDEPVEIVIDMPEALRELSADFYIVRAHEGECTLLNDLDDAAQTITIETACFSTYAIAYRLTDEAAGRCGLCHICPTFLGICYFIWLLLIVAAVIVVVIILRRRNEDTEEKKER